MKTIKKRTWKGFDLKLSTNCKLISNIKWMIIKSKSKPSKKVIKELSRAGLRLASSGNTIDGYYFMEDKCNILEVLKNQKSNTFQVVEIFDYQYGMSVNISDTSQSHTTTPDTPFVTKGENQTRYWAVTHKQFSEREIIIN